MNGALIWAGAGKKIAARYGGSRHSTMSVWSGDRGECARPKSSSPLLAEDSIFWPKPAILDS